MLKVDLDEMLIKWEINNQEIATTELNESFKDK